MAVYKTNRAGRKKTNQSINLDKIGGDIFFLDHQERPICNENSNTPKKVGDEVTVLVASKDFREVSSSNTGCYVNVGGGTRGGRAYTNHQEYQKGDMLPFGEYLHKIELFEVATAIIIEVKPASIKCSHSYYQSYYTLEKNE